MKVTAATLEHHSVAIESLAHGQSRVIDVDPQLAAFAQNAQHRRSSVKPEIGLSLTLSLSTSVHTPSSPLIQLPRWSPKLLPVAGQSMQAQLQLLAPPPTTAAAPIAALRVSVSP